MLASLLSTLALAGSPTIVEVDPGPVRLVVTPPPDPIAIVITGVHGDGLVDGDEEEDEGEASAQDERDPVDLIPDEPAPRRTAARVQQAPPAEAVPVTRVVPQDPAAAQAQADLDLLRRSESASFQPLTSSQHRWLKPTRGKFEPNPYQQVDFTAYTLEFGEVKVGLAAITVGVAPRVQLGTVPVENLAGIYNLHGKANLLRIRGFDLAVRGAVHALPLGDFTGTYVDVGGLVSQQLHKRLSVHAGGAYTSMTGRGVPDFSKASPIVTAITGDLGQYNPPEEWFGDQAPRVRAEALAARVAIDVRINRRDSFILQGQTLMRAAVVTELGDVQISEVLPPIAGLDEALSYEGNFSVSEAYIASFAYHAAWKQVDLRIGVGISSVPGAWVLQANELSYRFGGKTRRTETRTKKGWRYNRRDVAETVEEPEAPEVP